MTPLPRRWATLTMLASGGLLLQSCALFRALDDCFGENTISQREYDDLNIIEQLAWEENECGRYSERSSFLGDLFD